METELSYFSGSNFPSSRNKDHSEKSFYNLENGSLFPLKTLEVSLRRNWMLEQPLDFNGCSSIHFLNLPSFPNLHFFP